MRNTIIKLVMILISISLVTSCASRKDVIYLQDSPLESIIKYEVPTFKIDDRITINVSSINPEAARPFNLYITSFNTGGISSMGNQQQQSYLVDKKGNIRFPQLGEINVLGKTRGELEMILVEKLKGFLPDVQVNVQLINFRISVLGEVNKPGEYTINRDKVNVLQAIGLASDLTIHGKRDQVKLIRETNGIVNTYELDLTNNDLIISPFYYLKQNDILYVAPNKPRVNASASSPTASYIISATGLLITIISILTR